VKGAFARGIYLRDRSTEPGCAGSLRVATGIVEHTQRAIAVMDEVLCAAR
jgi:histidinol-phosphate/aromatic aminotransferase/cobyric acid decarboxylase-like protein